MLPLLPALLLLLLQGPSNVERLAHEGRLQGAIQAVSVSLERPVLSSDEQRKVLAELLVASSDFELNRALAQLLTLVLDEPSVETPSWQGSEPQVQILPCRAPAATADGFVKSQRSRDGPG